MQTLSWYSKICLNSKIDKIKILRTDGSLMKGESIAECSPWSILQYFWPALMDNRSWKPIFGLLFECPLKAGVTVHLCAEMQVIVLYDIVKDCWYFCSFHAIKFTLFRRYSLKLYQRLFPQYMFKKYGLAAFIWLRKGRQFDKRFGTKIDLSW